ncbi:rCG40867, partial [Rattus norvegicus]
MLRCCSTQRCPVSNVIYCLSECAKGQRELCLVHAIQKLVFLGKPVYGCFWIVYFKIWAKENWSTEV